MYRVLKENFTAVYGSLPWGRFFPRQDKLLICLVELSGNEREDFCFKGHIKGISRPIQLLVPLLQDTDMNITFQGVFL